MSIFFVNFLETPFKFTNIELLHKYFSRIVPINQELPPGDQS